MGKSINIGKIKIGGKEPFVLIAGPCVIENKQVALKTAVAIKKITLKLKIPFIFKASYDKANRTSVNSFRGPGIRHGLDILNEIKETVKVPILSDVHSVGEVGQAAEVLDILQIPAFLCRQTDLLIAAGKTKRIVNIKKGQFLAPVDIKQAIKKIEHTGNKKILLTERGTSFGYNNLVTDFRSLAIMGETGYPVVFDATHSVQQPGGLGTVSGGNSEFVPLLSRCGIAAGCDAVFMEVHPNPKKALSDGPNMLALNKLEKLLVELKAIDKIVKKKNDPECFMPLKKAIEVIKTEAQAIKDLVKRIDGRFSKTVDIIAKCKGRVIVTGMGKTGIIGRKIAATLSSTGTPSLWMHSAEAVHGDLGQVTKNDVVIVISSSGETDEIKRLLPLVKKIKSKIIAMTGNQKSTLAQYSDIVLDVSVKKEGCPLGLAPMASTTATLVMGDALAACLIVRREFKKENFAFYHPGGSLGRRLLLKVEDIMRRGAHYPKVKEGTVVKDVLLAITQARCGSACVLNQKGKFVGIFTDGDLRRHLETDRNLLERKVVEVMTKNPTTISKDKLAVEALQILQDKKIDELPVVDGKGKLMGLLDVQDLLKAGLV